MSLTAKKTGTLIGTATIQNGTGSGVSNRELQGTATITYGGAPSGYTALSLPGASGAYMALGTSHPANFDTSSTNFFIETWVYLNSLPAATKVYYIILRGTGVYAAEDIGLRLLPSGIAEFYSYGAGNTIAIPNSGTALSINTWYHLAGSIDSLSKTVYIFLNGVLKNQQTMAGAPRTTSGSNFFIGTPLVQSDWIATNAYVRDVRVLQGGAVPTSTFSAPSNVPFGLGTPTYISGMGTTVLSLYTQYFFPSWVSLSGNQGTYMNLGIPSGPYFSSTFNTFIQGWVYINSTAANAGYVIMSTATVEVNATEDWGLRVLSGGTLQFYLYNSSVVSTGVSSSSALSAGRWYHMAVSYIYNVGTYGTMYLFVNGVFQNSSAMSGGFPRFTSTNIITVGSRLTTLGWSPLNSYIQDLQFVRGGSVPTTTFTPSSAPFGLLAPSYVPGGTCVLSLATQYFLNTLSTVTPSGIAGGYGANVTGGDLTQIIAGNKVHFFTTIGTQTITVTGSGYVTVLVVAGGGGGGYDRAGGGGAGGLIYTQMILQPGTYSVTVGDGGAGSTSWNGAFGTGASNGTNGQNSSFGSLIALGGGGGGTYAAGSAGGSGGGGHGTNSYTGGTAGSNNQGNFGGAGLSVNGNTGGGGGAGGPGVDGGTGVNAVGGNGGPGLLIPISGTPTYYAGGGGGSIAFDSYTGTSGNGLGGIGGGGNSGQVRGANGSPGTANTGGGGGGGANIPQGSGGKGGSGIVIVSYPTLIPSQTINNSIFLKLSASAVNSSVAAYSLRAVRASTAKVVQIRRSSDSVTQDFYADPLGNLLTLPVSGQSLSSWLGSATGYVATWYDQSGQGKDLTQPTTSLQPAVSLATSPPSLVFTGSGTTSGQYLLNSAFSFNFGTYQYSIRAVVNNTVGGCLIYKGASGFPWNLAGYKKWWFGTLNSTTESSTGGYPNIVGNSEGYVFSQSGVKSSKMSVTWVSSAFSSVVIYEKSSAVSVSYNRAGQVSDPSTYLYLGTGGGASYYNGNVYEIEIFSTALSASDVTNME